MARQVTFTGTQPQRVGRFGMLKPGAVITVSEEEFRSVKDAPEFKETERDEKYQPIDLTDTPQFQFTTLPWGTPRIFRVLKRLGRKQLAQVAEGFAHLGIPANVSPDMSREDMAEIAVEAGRRAGWID